MRNVTTTALRIASLVASVTLFAATTGAFAQDSVEQFYKGRVVTMQIGAAGGGSADIWARTFAPFLTRHLPGNPQIIYQNKPGAGGLTVAHDMMENAPRDGSVIGTLQRNNFIAPLLAEKTIPFDPTKVNHLGSLSREIQVMFTYGKNPKAKTLEEAMKIPLKVGGTAVTAENVTYPLLANKLAGTKFDIVHGYASTDDTLLAVERGEVDARASSYDSTLRGQMGDWRKDGLLHVFMQFGLERDPGIPDVPSVMEHVTDGDARSIMRLMLLPQELGRPYITPPGIPEDRLAALRKAFIDAANDPEFHAAVEKFGASVDLVDGETVQKMAAEIMSTPPELVAKTKELLKP